MESSGNILDMYMHAVGESEVPEEWHRWTCFGLVAAAVSNRVYYKKFEWEKLAPNLYTFIVGPSGAGKGVALGFGKQFVHPMMNMLQGGMTKQGLFDYMASETESGVPRRNCMLIQPELADCLGHGGRASEMVKAMTEWYTPSADGFEDITRMHGARSIEAPCINWLAGTTVEWLSDCVDAQAMRSGFFGRVAVVPDEFNYERRVYAPKQPRNYEETVEKIKDRLHWMTQCSGEFKMTHSAREADKTWYENRRVPDELMRPFWRRQHDLALKLAMVLSLCDSLNLKINSKHITAAHDLSERSMYMLPDIIRFATMPESNQKINRVKDAIHSARKIQHTKLLRKMFVFNINAKELGWIVEHLLQEGRIERRISDTGAAVYLWVIKRRESTGDHAEH